jgi:hypothetical protein
MGVFPLHGVPCCSCKHPLDANAHVTGVFPWQVEPAVLHAFVQHCAEPAAP